MRFGAEYLVQDPDAARDQVDWTPEFSRRARGFAVYAALRSLGRSGVAELVERCCARARRFADAIAELPGCEVLNEVVLNQVLFRFADDATTARDARGGAGERRGVDERDDVGRPGRDPPLGVELADDRGRRRPHRRGLRGRARDRV